jgi:hypothetical protein
MKNFTWWIVEIIVWYLFFYAILFALKNPINIGWMAFILLLLGSFGLFASPLTRHLSVWNKILDRVVRKGEDEMN